MFIHNLNKMKNLIITLIISITTIATIEAQEGIRLSNFNAEKISNTELLISINYVLSEELDSKDIFIQANPVTKGGRNIYKEAVINRQTLEVGNHQVSFKISKKSGGKNFSSESIRVCVTESRNILLCEEFPFSMVWSEIEVSNVKIKSFISTETQVEKGDAVTLSWETENAVKVMLGKAGSTDFREVPSSGSETFTIDKTSTFLLMASPKSTTGPSIAESQKIKIEVTNNEPIIGSFYASHPTIRRGIKSKILWKVFGATQVSLNGETVEEIGDLVVSPTRTTNYVLKAQTADKIIEKTLSIYVTPFAPPKLSPPIYSLELCRRIDVNGGYSRCISSDGPFATGDEIYVIARFKNLPQGKYRVKRITYNGLYNSDKWENAHQEESSFENPGKGEGVFTFPIVNLGEGAKKLIITLNDELDTSSEIIYCIDCSRMWE